MSFTGFSHFLFVTLSFATSAALAQWPWSSDSNVDQSRSVRAQPVPQPTAKTQTKAKSCKMPFHQGVWAKVPSTDFSNMVCASNTAELRLHFPEIVNRLEMEGTRKVSGPMEGMWTTNSPMLACTKAMQEKTKAPRKTKSGQTVWRGCSPTDYSSTTLKLNSNKQGIQFQLITEDRTGKKQDVYPAESAQFCRTREGVHIIHTATHTYAVDFQDDQCAWFADIKNDSRRNWQPIFRTDKTFFAFLTGNIQVAAPTVPEQDSSLFIAPVASPAPSFAPAENSSSEAFFRSSQGIQ